MADLAEMVTPGARTRHESRDHNWLARFRLVTPLTAANCNRNVSGEDTHIVVNRCSCMPLLAIPPN